MADVTYEVEEVEQKKKKILIPELVRSEDLKIIVPKRIPLKDAIDFLTKQLVYDEQVVKLSETIPCFIFDGCLALQKALVEVFGFASQEEKVIEFMGQKIRIKPVQIQVECGPDETMTVPWGQFGLPGIEGYVQTDWNRTDEGLFVFQATAQVKHKDEDRVKHLFRRTREIAMAESLYRGKAIQVRFMDDDGEMIGMPQPRFVRLTDSPVIFQKPIEQALESNILSRIRYPDATVKATGKLKYGMLLAGVYGTGKTLCANMVARVATDNGWTFIYVKDVKELAIALNLAQSFQPAVVFAEDVDRAAGANRTEEVNKLLNTLDGLGTKSDRIITILTSNHPESINEAMRRPGRIDLVLEVKPPDAEAAERLIRLYGAGAISEKEDLREASKLLDGQIPAVIREAVERASMEALTRTKGASSEIESVDITISAGTLLQEIKLFRKDHDKRTGIEKFGSAMGEEISKGFSREVAKIGTMIEKGQNQLVS